MFTKLAKLLSPSRRKEEGFTLIELLIVVAIIAILAAIAIPQFSAYRKRGYNASANSDSRNLRTTQEAMYADFQDYGISVATTDNNGNHTNGGTLYTAGATLMNLCGMSSATTCQSGINLSPTVSAVAHAYNGGGSKNVRYAVGTKHQQGDVLYGVGSHETSPYRRTASEGVLMQASDVTTPADTTTNNFPAPTWSALQ